MPLFLVDQRWIHGDVVGALPRLTPFLPFRTTLQTQPTRVLPSLPKRPVRPPRGMYVIGTQPVAPVMPLVLVSKARIRGNILGALPRGAPRTPFPRVLETQ